MGVERPFCCDAGWKLGAGLVGASAIGVLTSLCRGSWSPKILPLQSRSLVSLHPCLPPFSPLLSQPCLWACSSPSLPLLLLLLLLLLFSQPCLSTAGAPPGRDKKCNLVHWPKRSISLLSVVYAGKISHFPIGTINPKDQQKQISYTSSTAQGGGGSFKNRKPIGDVGCCESGMAERSHWLTERWLELCLLEWLQWLQWSPHPQLLDAVWCTATVVVVVA